MTLHALTKSVQIVCQGTFAVFSDIVFSCFGGRRLLSFEDAVHVKLCLTSGPDGENMRDPRIAVKDVSSELRHLDEGESDSIMLAWTKVGETRYHLTEFGIPRYLRQDGHVRRCVRKWFRSTKHSESNVRIRTRDLSNDVPSEEVLSPLGDVAEDAIPTFDGARAIRLRRNRAIKTNVMARQFP